MSLFRQQQLKQKYGVTQSKPSSQVVSNQQEISSLEQERARQLKEIEDWKLAERLLREGKTWVIPRGSPLRSKVAQLQQQGLRSWEALEKEYYREIYTNPIYEGGYTDAGTGKGMTATYTTEPTPQYGTDTQWKTKGASVQELSREIDKYGNKGVTVQELSKAIDYIPQAKYNLIGGQKYGDKYVLRTGEDSGYDYNRYIHPVVTSKKTQKAKEFGRAVWDYTGGFVISAGKGGLKIPYEVSRRTISLRNKILKRYGLYKYYESEERRIKKIENLLNYSKDRRLWQDEDVQNFIILVSFHGIGMTGKRGYRLARYSFMGVQGYAGYKFIKEPSPTTAGHFIGMSVIPTVIGRGMKSWRVRAGYKKALRDMERSFGKNSKEVKEFKVLWNRGFRELPRNVPLKKGKITNIDQLASKIKAKEMNILERYILSKSIRGFYSPLTKRLRLRQTGDVGIRIHEGIHSIDPALKKRFKVENKGVSRSQIEKDMKEVSGDFYARITKNHIERHYKKGDYQVEALAYFGQENPKQIINPSTKTGLYLNKLFKKNNLLGETERVWTARTLKGSWGDKILQEIINKHIRHNKAEVIGSTVITPQTSLKKLPRGKAGDVDVQNVPLILGRGTKSKKMANEMFREMKSNGYNVKLQVRDFFGKPKYHITKDGKELVNIGTSSKYFTKTQAGPILNWYESDTLGAWKKDAFGVKMGSIRDQLRVKLWKGFVEKTRPKDIIDAKGIKKGTDYLFKDKIKTTRKELAITERKIQELYEKTGKAEKKYSLEYKEPKYYGKYSRKYGGYSSKSPYKRYKPYEPPKLKYYPKSKSYTYIPRSTVPTKGQAYSPYVTTLPPKGIAITREMKSTLKKGVKKGKKDELTVHVYQPEYIKGKKKETGFQYETKKEAIAEGIKYTDRSPYNHFVVKRVPVEKTLLRRGSKTKVAYKFLQKGNTFTEKKAYRRDAQGEGFNIIPYVFGKHK